MLIACQNYKLEESKGGRLNELCILVKGGISLSGKDYNGITLFSNDIFPDSTIYFCHYIFFTGQRKKALPYN
jgi:hypothetical protein